MMNGFFIFNRLSRILTGFRDKTITEEPSTANNKARLHNVTDYFYTITDGRYKIKDSLKTNTKRIKMLSPPDFLPDSNMWYVLGKDTLTRNHLSSLAPDKPTVYVVTWVENCQIHYATIVKTNKGSGIYSNWEVSVLLEMTQ